MNKKIEQANKVRHIAFKHFNGTTGLIATIAASSAFAGILGTIVAFKSKEAITKLKDKEEQTNDNTTCPSDPSSD